MRRYHLFYAQCPEFNGDIPDAHTPARQREDHTHNYNRPRGEPLRPAWRPHACVFRRTDTDQGASSTIAGTLDLDVRGEREALANQYSCTVHSVPPVLWARGSAYRRRTQHLLDERWEPRNETINWTDRLHNQRVAHVTIWHPRRPAPKTMHTAWTALAG